MSPSVAECGCRHGIREFRPRALSGVIVLCVEAQAVVQSCIFRVDGGVHGMQRFAGYDSSHSARLITALDFGCIREGRHLWHAPLRFWSPLC